MTDNASRAAEAAYDSLFPGTATRGPFFIDRARYEGFTAGVAWSREQSAAKPADSGEVAELRAEVERLNALINTPHTDHFFDAVRIESAHQVERWGTKHDAGKKPSDWFWLLGYLSGKALTAATRGDNDKALHHVISSAASLFNWYRALRGVSTLMRPGIEPPQELAP